MSSEYRHAHDLDVRIYTQDTIPYEGTDYGLFLSLLVHSFLFENEYAELDYYYYYYYYYYDIHRTSGRRYNTQQATGTTISTALTLPRAAMCAQEEDHKTEPPPAAPPTEKSKPESQSPPPLQPPSPPPPQPPPPPPPPAVQATPECPCPCHETTVMHEGRPWIGFSNAGYLVCAVCWVEAYTRAHGGDQRFGYDCETYLRGRGKDPKVPPSKQC
ncbi:hypothetical protein K445DRAFT_299379 [Daldinia sp. EC12]|nr:hypothetical protein K445DRAFT_299379 [Daldinia sp. EC12]